MAFYMELEFNELEFHARFFILFYFIYIYIYIYIKV